MKFADEIFDELIFKILPIQLKKARVSSRFKFLLKSTIYLSQIISSYTIIDKKEKNVIMKQKREKVFDILISQLNYYDLDYRIKNIKEKNEEKNKEKNIGKEDKEIQILSKKYFLINLKDLLRKEKINEISMWEFLFSLFLVGAKISNPQNEYRISINIDILKLYIYLNKEEINRLENLLEDLRTYLLDNQISHIFSEYRGEYVLKFNSKDSISNLLALLNLTNSVLNFENIVLKKEIKGDINRKINFEMANMQRTIQTAAKQLNTIKRIKELGLYEKLSENYKEVIKLREKNTDMSISDLAKIINKSPATIVNYFKNMNKMIEET